MTNSDLASLAGRAASFTSVYLPSPSDHPNAGLELAARWRTLRSQLADEGAGERVLEAIDAAVGVDTRAVITEPRGVAENQPPGRPVDASADHAGGDVLAVIAADDEVVVREHLPHGGDRDAGVARIAPLPLLTPLLVAAQSEVPHVVVLADRTGADLHAWGHGHDVATTVTGSQDQIERNAPGGWSGWSQSRYQRRAIDSWERNAAEVAAEVAHVADEVGARLVLVGGDGHAVSALVGDLPPRLAGLVHHLEHANRAAGNDRSMAEDEIRRLLDTARAEDEVELIRHYREELGRSAKAAAGPEAVVHALQAAMVDTLLVHDEPDDDRTAWFGPEPNQLALDREELDDMGVSEPQQARLVDVAVRAALGTGASVRVLPGTVLDDGFGAVLRA